MSQLPSADANDDLTGDAPESELEVVQFLTDYYEGGPRRLVRKPKQTLAAIRAIGRLRMLSVEVDGSPEGAMIRHQLDRITSRWGWLLPQKTLADVLAIPAAPGDFVQGRSRQTLRRKVRQAEKAGVTWRLEESPEERAVLLEKLAAWERIHPLEQYRYEDPQLGALAEVKLWLVAESKEGEPLLVSVIPIVGEWALFRYFRTIGQGDEQSLARYYMTKVLVEELSKRGVRYLADADTPHRVPPGLRHFQRMTAWRLARLRFGS